MAQPRMVDLDEQAKLLSCTTAILADNAVTTPKLAVGAVTGVTIADATIGADKFLPSVFGEGLVYNSFTNAIDLNIDLSDLQISADQLQIKDFSLGAIKFKPSVFGNGLVYNSGLDSIDINFDNATMQIAADVLGVKPLGITTPYINIDNDLSFNNHQILSFRVENVTFDPPVGNIGRLIWRTDTQELKLDTGVAFITAGGHTIQDEGVALTQRPILNFIGTGVTVTDIGGKTQVDIPGNNNYAKDSITVSNAFLDHTILLSTAPVVNSEIVSWNGLVLRYGVLNDYTISGTTLTINPGITLTIGDIIQVVYAY